MIASSFSSRSSASFIPPPSLWSHAVTFSTVWSFLTLKLRMLCPVHYRALKFVSFKLYSAFDLQHYFFFCWILFLGQYLMEVVLTLLFLKKKCFSEPYWTYGQSGCYFLSISLSHTHSFSHSGFNFLKLKAVFITVFDKGVRHCPSWPRRHSSRLLTSASPPFLNSWPRQLHHNTRLQQRDRTAK